MSKFDAFLKRVLTVIFKEMPFNRQKADENLEKIKILQCEKLRSDECEYDKLRN